MSPVLVLLAAAMGAGVPAPEIRGDTACPTPEAVALALRPLVPDAPDAGGPASTVLLSEQGAGVTVRLFTPELRLLEERTLADGTSCDDRARAAAVIIASWLGPLPEVMLAPIALASAPEPQTEGSVSIQAAPGKRPSRAQFAVSAAGLASLTKEGFAPGLLIGVSVRRPRSPWSLSVEGMLEGTHRIGFLGGEGAWSRLGLGVFGGHRWSSGRTWMEPQVGFLLTGLLVEGSGFTDNFASEHLDVGAALCTRAGVTLAGWAPWGGACAVGWGGTQRLTVSGVGASAEISRAEVLFVLGASFGRGAETF